MNTTAEHGSWEGEAFEHPKLQGVFDELDIQRNVEKDIYINALNDALEWQIRNNPLFRKIVEDFIDENPEMASSYIVNRLQRSTQKEPFRNRFNSGYPIGFETLEPWLSHISQIASDPQKQEDYARTLRLETKTTKSDRYAFVPLLVQLTDLVPKNPVIVDEGTGQMHGPKRLAMLSRALTRRFYKHQAAFKGIKVYDEIPDPLDTDRPRYIQNGDRTRAVGMLLLRNFDLGFALGIDLDDPRSPEIQERAERDTFGRPADILNTTLEAEYQLLEDVDFEYVRFMQGDVSALRPSEIRAALPTTPHMVVHSVSMYQSPGAQQEEILEKDRALAPLIVVQDNVEIDPNDRTKLIFQDHWFAKPFGFRTLISLSDDPRGRFYEIFRWRGNQMVLGADAARFITSKALQMPPAPQHLSDYE